MNCRNRFVNRAHAHTVRSEHLQNLQFGFRLEARSDQHAIDTAVHPTLGTLNGRRPNHVLQLADHLQVVRLVHGQESNTKLKEKKVLS